MSEPIIQKDEPKTPPANGNTKPRSLTRTILIITIITLVSVVGVVTWTIVKAPRGEAIVKIVGEGKDNPGMLPDDEKQLGLIVKTNYCEYQRNSLNWSAAYFSCLLLSAVFSALAGFVLKIKAFSGAAVLKEDLAALLAMTAALLITLSTVGEFQRKWQANRMAASDTEALAYDLLKSPFGNAERAEVIAKLREIASQRNREIVGDRPSGQPAPSERKEGSPSPTPNGANGNSNSKPATE